MRIKQILSVVLSLLIVQAEILPAAAAPYTDKPFSKLAPSTSIATLSAGFIGAKSVIPSHELPDVIIIQDLHFNYSVQKNIAKLLEYLSQKHALGPVMALEGATGSVDQSALASVADLQVRRELADFLMKNGHLTGAQYFAALSAPTESLQGVEDPVYFQENRDVYRLSYTARKNAGRQAADLRARLLTLIPAHYSRPVRKIHRLVEAVEAGESPVDSLWSVVQPYGQRAGVALPPALAAGSASGSESRLWLNSAASYSAVLNYAADVQEALALNREERNLVRLLADLSLIGKALSQHLTLEEVRAVSRRVDAIGPVIELLSPDMTASGRAISEAVHASIDYYVAAVMRNAPLLENTLRWARVNEASHRSTVLVVGGFHSNYLTQELRSRGLSYAVFTPRIIDHSDADDALYEKRFLGEEMSKAEAARQILQPSNGHFPRLFEGAGYIPRIPAWFTGLRDAAVRGGGLTSTAVRSWATRIRDEATLTSNADHEIASVLAQELSKLTFESHLGSIFGVFYVVTLPWIVMKELTTVLLALPMRLRRELFLNRWTQILMGRPFLPPPAKSDQFPVWSGWMKVGGVMGTMVYPVIAWAAWAGIRLYGGADIGISTVPSQIWFFGIYSALGIVAEITAEYLTERGEIFSTFEFAFDKTIPELLSVDEGQRQLRRAAERYMTTGDPYNSSTVFLVRLDPPFQWIVTDMMGAYLANIIRRRIYSQLVRNLREHSAGALVAATDAEDTLMVIIPAHRGGRETLRELMAKSISDVQSRWLNNEGYWTTDVPGLRDLRINTMKHSPRTWRAIEEEMTSAGIYFDATSADGTVLVMSPMDPLARNPANLEATQTYVNSEMDRIARKFHIAEDEMPKIVLAPHDERNPFYPVTLSAVGISLHKADEKIAWDSAEGRAGMVNLNSTKAARVPVAQAYLNNRYPSSGRGMFNPDRLDSLVQKEDLLLQSMLRAFDDHLGVIVTGKTARDNSSTVEVMAIAAPSDIGSTQIPLLSSDLAGALRLPRRYLNGPVAPEARRRLRVEAQLRLRDYLARLDPEVAQMRLDWQDMRKSYGRWLEAPAELQRTDHVYVSGLTQEQADYYAMTTNLGSYPSKIRENATSVHPMANPMAKDQNLPSYGKADGSGMALLNVVRDYVQRKTINLPPGKYNFREIMRDSMPILKFGAGNSTRNPFGGLIGKFMHSTLIRRFRDYLIGHDRSAEFAEVLLTIAAVIQESFPRSILGRVVGGNVVKGAMILLYGDNATTMNPAELKVAFSRNPEISEGLILVLRKVPFLECVDYGTAIVNQAGQIMRFEEKPGLDILQRHFEARIQKENSGLAPADVSKQAAELKEAAVGIIKDSFVGVNEEVLSQKVQEKGLGQDFDELREMIRLELKDRGLLVDEGSIYMNAGITVAGLGTMILLARMAGAQMEPTGSFEIMRKGNSVLRDSSHARTIIAVQDRMTAAHGSRREATLPLIAEILEFVRQTADPILRDTLIEIMSDWQQEIDVDGIGDDDVRAAYDRATYRLNDQLSLFDDLLITGINNLDIMGHLAPKMAMQADPGREIVDVARGVAKKEGKNLTNDDSVARAERRLKALERASVEVLSANAESELVKRRRELQDAGIAAKDVSGDAAYVMYAMVHLHARIWEYLHQPKAQRGAGQAFAAIVKGSWWDMGGTQIVKNAFLRLNSVGAAVSAVYGFAHRIFSRNDLGPSHSINSVIRRRTDSDYVDPLSLTIDAYLVGNDQAQTPLVLEAGSMVKYASIPWGFHLYKNSAVTEAISSLTIAGEPHPVPVVSYRVWMQEIKPADEALYFEAVVTEESAEKVIPQPVQDWIRQYGINNGIWAPGDKHNMWYAKLFPAASLKAIRAALEGKTGHELRLQCVDDLDFDIVRDQALIWEWLQHRENGTLIHATSQPAPGEFTPPETWLRALRAGRVLSMKDQQVDSEPTLYAEMMRWRAEKVAAEVHRQPVTAGVPVTEGHWISGPVSIPSSTPRQHADVLGSTIFARRAGLAGWASAGFLALALVAGSVFGVAIPGIVAGGVGVLGASAIYGSNALQRQASVLQEAERRARLARLQGMEPSGVSPADVDQLMSTIRSRYEKSNGKILDTDDYGIFHRDGVTSVDPLVAYFVNDQDPSILHSILSYHEPSHHRGWGETISYLLQAYTAPLYLAGPVSSRRYRGALAALAIFFLPLAIVDQVVAALMRLRSRGIGKMAVDAELEDRLSAQADAVATLLRKDAAAPSLAPSSAWGRATAALARLTQHTRARHELDEATARQYLGQAA